MERVYGNEEGGGGRKTVESFLGTYSSPLLNCPRHVA